MGDARGEECEKAINSLNNSVYSLLASGEKSNQTELLAKIRDLWSALDHLKLSLTSLTHIDTSHRHQQRQLDTLGEQVESKQRLIALYRTDNDLVRND